MIGQAGTYTIDFFIGEICEEPLDSFTITIIVYPYPDSQYDFGDAPEHAIAYPSSGVQGKFPTCSGCGEANYIRHATENTFFWFHI